jgi:enediyne polyketide synthase
MVLDKLGIQAEIGLGHSLGELTALHWAGVFDASTLLRLAQARGEAIAQVRTLDGMMMSIQANAQTVSKLIRNTSVVISGFNSPLQTVVAGDILSINKVAAQAYALGLPCVRLAVSHAFHSPLVSPAVATLATYLRREHFAQPARTVVSTVTGDFLKQACIEELLCTQITAPVRFLEAVERIQNEIDLFIEVGPGTTLTRLLPDITAKPGIATDAGGTSIGGILSACASAFVLGAAINTSALFAHRFTRPISLDWRPAFLVNPCEQAPLAKIEYLDQAQESTIKQPEGRYPDTHTTFELVQQTIATHTELSLELFDIESRMLSDLHLNSITVGQILTECSRVLGLAPSASLIQYADAKLGDIVQVLEDLQRQGNVAGQQAQEKDSEGIARWVRCFSVIEQAQPLALSQFANQNAGDWQVFAPRGYRFTQDFLHTFASIQGVGSLVCLPVDAETHVVNLLLQGAQALLGKQEATHFVLVQHGEIGAAFARTLYLEQPQLTVCIIHVPLDLPDLTTCISTEVQAAQGFVEARYNEQGKRSKPVLASYLPVTGDETCQLGAKDVLLVAGGGKGITAACSLALAQQTGVTLALLGRSHPQSDPSLAKHLANLEAAGIRYQYLSVDVLDAPGVIQAVNAIEAHLGPITGILYGVGINNPMLLHMLDAEAFAETFAPKVKGLQNVLAAISPQQIRHLITFGSVIACTGMPGEAHYALANEWLGQITAAFQSAYPACSCLCIEWSVWSDIGMGERLGRVAALRAAGITPIPVEEGVALFLRLISHNQTITRIVASGRFGAMPTLQMATRQLPFLRFLEKPLVFYPDVELIVDVEMSTSTDPYLNDHQLQHERIVPAVMSLEAMAQIAQAVKGSQTRPAFSDVRFASPLVIPEHGSVTLRILALVLLDGSVEVLIRSSETAYQADHLRAVCSFAQQITAWKPSIQWQKEPLETGVQLQPSHDLYGQILFQKGRFQRIQRYISLHARECRVELTLYTDNEWFARYLPGELILGDPARRDAMMHAVLACIPQATLIPVGIESLLFSEQPSAPEQHLQVWAREREQRGNSFIYDIEARNSDGQILEQWYGLHLQLVGSTLPQQKWAEVLFGPYFERRIADFYPQWPILLTFHRETGSFLALDQHTSKQGGWRIDMAELRSGDNWQALLTENQFRLAEHLASTSLENFARAAMRVLVASKLLKEIAPSFDNLLMPVKVERDGWQILGAGPYIFLTFITQLRSCSQPFVFTFYRRASSETE